MSTVEWLKKPMNLRIGNQIKAARALADINQQRLADLADVNVNTIRAMEARGANVLVSGLDTVMKVQSALENEGVLFLSAGEFVAGGPGVRLAKNG